MIWIGLILFVAALILYIKSNKHPNQTHSPELNNIENFAFESETAKGHYQAKYLLTKNEWYEYKKLHKYAVAHDLQICPKVRLLDIVEPRRGEGYMSYLGKIKSKHVDFVITDKDLHIKAILELDDSSHDANDRKARDTLVDDILQDVGYIVIRTRSITETTLDPITAKKESITT